MTASRFDWVVMWKLFHLQFFWIYLTLAIPIRFVTARHFGAASSRKTNLSVVVASFASSLFSTWLPIVPILGVGLPLGLLGRTAVGESTLIGVPLVAISMGIEATFLDAVLFCLLLKESVKERFVSLLIANVLNAAIALALGLAWAFHHLPTFVADARQLALTGDYTHNRTMTNHEDTASARHRYWNAADSLPFIVLTSNGSNLSRLNAPVSSSIHSFRW